MQDIQDEAEAGLNDFTKIHKENFNLLGSSH